MVAPKTKIKLLAPPWLPVVLRGFYGFLFERLCDKLLCGFVIRPGYRSFSTTFRTAFPKQQVVNGLTAELGVAGAPAGVVTGPNSKHSLDGQSLGTLLCPKGQQIRRLHIFGIAQTLCNRRDSTAINQQESDTI